LKGFFSKVLKNGAQTLKTYNVFFYVVAYISKQKRKKEGNKEKIIEAMLGV
jgi:hypothetical protein